MVQTIGITSCPLSAEEKDLLCSTKLGDTSTDGAIKQNKV